MKDKTENRATRAAEGYADSEDFVTFNIAGQLFGLPVLGVQDILSARPIAAVPLAPVGIAGSLNLRGRIVTTVDVRSLLGLPRTEGMGYMSVVVADAGDLYSLMVDSVGEVLDLALAEFERNPANLDAGLRRFSKAIYRLKDQLLVVLDVQLLLHDRQGRAA